MTSLAAKPVNSFLFNDENLEFLLNGKIVSEKFQDIIITLYFHLKTIVSKQIIEKQFPSIKRKILNMGTMPTTVPPIGMGKDKEIKETNINFYLHIIFKDGIYIKIDSSHFDFSCLKEEKTYSADMNLKILVRTIAKLCPQAFKNLPLCELLSNKLSLARYDSLAEIEKEISRLMDIYLSTKDSKENKLYN